MTVFACRGEYEPVSFVVSAAKPLEAVRIEAEPLNGPGGQWPEAALDVRVVKSYYRGALAGAATIPTLLVHDESFLAIEPDPTPENPNNMKNGAGCKIPMCFSPSQSRSAGNSGSRCMSLTMSGRELTRQPCGLFRRTARRPS